LFLSVPELLHLLLRLLYSDLRLQPPNRVESLDESLISDLVRGPLNLILLPPDGIKRLIDGFLRNIGRLVIKCRLVLLCATDGIDGVVEGLRG